ELRIAAVSSRRSKLGEGRLTDAFFPGHGHEGRGQRGEGGDSPEIDAQGGGDHAGAGQDGEVPPGCSARGVVEATSQVWSGLAETDQEFHRGHHQHFGVRATPLEANFLARVEALSLPDLPIGPPAGPPVFRGDLEALAHEPERCGMADGRLAVEVAGRPWRTHHERVARPDRSLSRRSPTALRRRAKRAGPAAEYDRGRAGR